MLIMTEIIAESEAQMYKSGITKGKSKEKPKKGKDVRQAPSHIHNKPHGLIAVSHHPASIGESEEQP